ncbi:unnamed protein product [Ixodes persulcatus]
MVLTIKELFRKAEDPFLALLAYRNPLGVSGCSQAQLLTGHSLRTRLPVTAPSLVSHWPQVKDLNERDVTHGVVDSRETSILATVRGIFALSKTGRKCGYKSPVNSNCSESCSEAAVVCRPDAQQCPRVTPQAPRPPQQLSVMFCYSSNN